MSPDGTVAYVINSAAWSIVGAAMVLIYQRLRDRRNMPPRDRYRPNWTVLIAVLVLLIAIANAILGWQVDHRQRQFTACQANVNQTRTEALNRITDLASEDRSTVDEMVRAVALARTREETNDALVKYLAKRQMTERERQAQGPLPEPKDLCGEPPA